MSNQFNQIIDRQNTSAIKWEIIQDKNNPEQWIKTDAYFGKDNILPMWVADMDLSCPEPVRRALEERARHPIYGYTMVDDEYYHSVVNWMKRRHGWQIQQNWIVTTPGVIPALHVLVRAFTKPGQKVQRPVYYPFFSAIEENKRQIVSNSLRLENGQYHMDYNDLEKLVRDPEVTMTILSNPHNPVGRVWNLEEIDQFVRICERHDVLVVSDEIHGDLIYQGNTFTPVGLLNEELVQNCIICTAPSKTFNLAGLQISNIIIPNDHRKSVFKKALKTIGYLGPNPFGMVACKAAYLEGEQWLEALLQHLEFNRQQFITRFSERLPGIAVINPEGTYLIWFDCRSLGLGDTQLRRLMLEKARVCLDEGYIFGREGSGFERINIACPRSILEEAIDRIVTAINGI